LLFTVLLCSFLGVSLAGIQCLDTDGNAVDWWLMFKLGDPVSPYKGYTTMYTDVNDPASWTMGNINETSALQNTIMQLGLYGGSVDTDSVGWGIWNDQTHYDLDGKCDDHEKDSHGSIYGHTKGTIGFDSQTGFWLAHSAPGFPYDHSISPDYWHFPYAQTIYAQHFFCVSVKAADINRFGAYLQYFHAYVYDSNIPSGMSMTNFAAFTQDKFHKTETSITLVSLGGHQFTAVGKYAATNADLYEDYVAPLLGSGLYVQSWCGGTYEKACEPSYCEGDDIVDPSDPQQGQTTYAYDSVTIESVNFQGHAYDNAYNHAKWAVSSSSTPSPWFCAGDNNRQYTQRLRGGGALCMQHPVLYKTLMNVISAVNVTCSS